MNSVLQMRALAALLLLAMLPSGADAVVRDASLFQPRTYGSPQGGSLPYGLFVPRNLDPTKRYPMVLFLHGAGERGVDNRRQLRDIQAWTSESVQSKFPCFIVAPQCPNLREVFQLFGVDSERAITTYRNYAGSEKQWKRYQISPGRQVTGKMSWLFFVNDGPDRNPPVESLFRGVKVYETGQAGRAKAVDFRKVALTPYSGGGAGNNPVIEDDGQTLHILGDSRRKIPFQYTVTKNTIIEFDFKSGVQGTIHGIGFDDNDQMNDCRWVQVDWGAPSHTMPREPSAPMRLVMELLPALQKEFPAIDARRWYATGLSMGGFGTWDLMARHPDWFAAAVPICGGADLETVNAVAPIPIWDFHGSLDSTVRPDRSRNMIAALWNVGAEPRYTEYQSVGHDSWTKAYQEPGLLPWLFAQRRHLTPPPPPTNLQGICSGASRVDLSWKPPKGDESSVKEYRVYRDGGEIGFTLEPHFTDTEISERDVHNYTVVAVDREWLKSHPTPQIWVKVPPDTAPPRVTAVEAQGSSSRVEVHFDKPLDSSQATDTENYSLDKGITVNSAVLLPGQRIVRLDTAALTPKMQYHLKVRRIADRAAKPNLMHAEINVSFTYDPCLVAHWRLDEGEGAFSADATGIGSGSSGNVVQMRMLEWVPGRWGKALNFDGVGDHYAWTHQSQSLDFTDGLTVSLWVKKNGGQYTHQTLIAKSNYYDRRTQFMIDLDPSQQLRAIVGTLDKGEIVATGKRIDARDWHHVALTYGNNTLVLYIDGVRQDQSAGGDKLMSVSEMITIGSGHQGRDPIRGALDEIRIYNRALNETEVKALATAFDE